MPVEIATLLEQVNDAMRHQRCVAQCAEITDELALAIATNSHSDELKVLNYQWQTFVGKKYVQEHQLDDFLESIVEHLLKTRPERPLDEIISFLA